MACNRFLKLFVILSLMFSTINADDYFFMPKDKELALNAIIKSIDSAKESINIAIYSFTHKAIADRLKLAGKRGVKVKIVFDKENAKESNSVIGYISKYQNLETFIISGLDAGKYDGKMHLKMAIIDNKRVIFGSANWSKSAFDVNYELLSIVDSYPVAKNFNSYFEEILKEAKSY